MEQRKYAESELKFKNEYWIPKGCNALGLHDSDTERVLSELFDHFYERSEIEIENTQTGDTSFVSSEKFFMGAAKKFILNESGTLTWKHKIKLGVIIPIIQSAIKIRQIKKKLKILMAKTGDSIKYAIYSNEEYTFKIIINGLYGLFLYSKSIFYNPSVGATVTSAGRNVISTSALTVELIGNGYRSYLIEAHLQIISISKSEAEELSKKYTLPKVDVETVLKHMLAHYYDTYYAKSFLRKALESCTDDELSVVYLKNNFKAFVQVPEVRDLIVTIYKENTKWRDDLTEEDADLEEKIVKLFKRKNLSEEDVRDNTRLGRSYMAGYAKHPIYGSLAKQLKKMSGELLMGFFFYSGDYLDGTYCQTTVDIFENMERVKIPTVDTDSNVSSVFDEKMVLNELYSEYVNDDEYIYEVGSTVMATIIFTGAIDRSLGRYTTAVGVDDDYAHLIEMEEETTMYDLHLTTGKKKYVFSYFLQDGNFNKDVYNKIKIKGLQVIKSDYNAEICNRVQALFKSRIMVKLDTLDYRQLILDAKSLTDDIMKMIRSDDYIINKSTVKKANKTALELGFGEARNKMSRLWYRFNLPGDIDFPCSFKELDVKFSEHSLSLIEKELPDQYEALVEHVKELKLFTFYRSCINGAIKFLEGRGKLTLNELEVIDKCYAKAIIRVSEELKRADKEQLDVSLARYISRELFDSSCDDKFIKLVRKVYGLGPRDVVYWDSETNDCKLDVTNEDIIENIEKIGLPLDINTVPEFLKIDNYSVIDTEFAAIGEFLLSNLVDTMGISCPRNTSDKQMISSALQTY